MKTLTIISALSLALIFTGINTSFAKEKGNAKGNPTTRVKYQVTIHLDVINTLCNIYDVEMLDANGRLVAPAQIYVPGNLVYTFEEQTRQTVGVRIARLVPNWSGDHYVCAQELYTPPAVKLINFKDGQAYFFDLYPSTAEPK
jgi:hypothetical protein